MTEEYKDLPPEQAKFEIGLDENPQNWSLRLAYSCYLAGVGKFDEAKCQRWLGLNEQSPFIYPVTGKNEWHFGNAIDGIVGTNDLFDGHRVPSEMKIGRYNQESYLGKASRREAELTLARDMVKYGVKVELAQMKIPPDDDYGED